MIDAKNWNPSDAKKCGKEFAVAVDGRPVSVAWDDDINEWQADAPDGYRFGSGPLRLIAAGSLRGRITAAERREMLAELFERLACEDLEECDDE